MRLPCLRRLAVIAAALPAVALAASLVEATLSERVRRADRVVLAQVLESRTLVTEMVAPRTEAGRPTPRMLTVTKVAVGEDYKGRGPPLIEVVQLGGRSGLWEAHVPGDARFEPGETAILLLRCRDQVAPERCALVGLGEGRLRVLGEQVLVPSVSRGQAVRRPLRAVVDEVRAAAKVTR